MSFDEYAHPRSSRGSFTFKSQSPPEVILTVASSQDVTDFTDKAEMTTLRPRTQTELVYALDGAQPEKHGRIRRVRIGEGFIYMTESEVRGPTDGSPLLIDVEEDAGAGSLNIIEGRVVVRVNSSHPFDITASGRSRVTVVVARGRASMVAARDHANVIVIAEDGARGVLRMESADSVGDVVGDSRRFHQASTYRWDL